MFEPKKKSRNFHKQKNGDGDRKKETEAPHATIHQRTEKEREKHLSREEKALEEDIFTAFSSCILVSHLQNKQVIISAKANKQTRIIQSEGERDRCGCYPALVLLLRFHISCLFSMITQAEGAADNLRSKGRERKTPKAEKSSH